MKLIVLALDGFDTSMLDFPECGMLRELFKSKPSSKLRSMLPYSTPVAFASMQTGQDPARHGIHYFFKNGNPFNGLTPIPCSGKDLGVETFYEILYRYGKKCFIAGLPLSYPPKIPGDIVFDWTSGIKDPKMIFHPQDLLRKYPYLVEYKAFPDKALSISDWVNSIHKITRAMSRLILDVVRGNEYDLSMFYIQSPDALSHRLLPSMVDNEQDNSVKIAKESFKEIDKLVSTLISELVDDRSLIIMSDHGHVVYDYTLNINNWLAENGYLYYSTNASANENATSLLYHRKHNESYNVVADKKPLQVPKWLGNLGRDNPRLKPIAAKVRNLLEDKTGRAITDDKYVDIEKSLAASAQYGAIYLNPNLPVQRRQSIRRDIINRLSRIDEVQAYDTAEIYEGPFLSHMPEIHLSSNKYRFARYGTSTIEGKRRPDHRREGMIILAGTAFDKSPNNPTLLDLAPTILHLFGVPVPNNMQGRVLMETFSRNSEVSQRNVQYVQPRYRDDDSKDPIKDEEQGPFTKEEEEEINNRLKSLGYV